MTINTAKTVPPSSDRLHYMKGKDFTAKTREATNKSSISPGKMGEILSV